MATPSVYAIRVVRGSLKGNEPRWRSPRQSQCRKQGKTLKELAAEILRQRGARRDFIADTRHTQMTPEGSLTLENGDGDLRPEDAGQRARFLREAETWAALGGHQDIVSARHVHELDGRLFVAADFVPPSADRGNTLESYVGLEGLNGRLPAFWVVGFCDGMSQTLHRGVIAHR